MASNGKHLVSSILYNQLKKDKDLNQLINVECAFKPTQLHYIKFEAKPVRGLPQWHHGKGEKGWVFMDEVCVN